MQSNLKRLAVASILASLGASAIAANYYYVQPKSGEMAKVAPFSVALGATSLPVGLVGQAYNAGVGFNLAPFAVVAGDPALNQALVTFNVSAGELPAGISLSAAGNLSGTPSGPAGDSNIQVTASYKNATGMQSYTLATTNRVYATWNSSDKSVFTTLSAGNLTSCGPNGYWSGVRATVGKSSGKWYWETSGVTTYPGISNAYADTAAVMSLGMYIYRADGYTYYGNTGNGGMNTAIGVNNASQVRGYALDMDAKTLTVSGPLGSYTMTGISAGTYFPYISVNNTCATGNFGSTAFTYAVPAGYNPGVF